jgi:acyl carrier protein
MEISKKIIDLLGQHKDIPTEKISESSNLTDLGMDSLDYVELIMQAEDEFGITLKADSSMTTVGELVQMIKEATK